MVTTQGTLKTIIELGNPVLRKTASKVDDVAAPDIQQLIDDMILTVKKAPGVGLAAPQIGIDKRIFIVTPGLSSDDPDGFFKQPVAVINPKITGFSSEIEEDWEGCLSIPGLRGKVNRPVSITVEFTQRDGATVELDVHGFVARIFQHENDHLDGIIFLDRMTSMKSLMMDSEYSKMMER